MLEKSIDSNAKTALKEMKLEIAEEMGMDHVTIPVQNGEKTSKEYGFYGGPVGGEMTRRLVTMGEKLLLRETDN